MSLSVKQDFIIPNRYFGLRLDQVLCELMPNYSRARIQDWLKKGEITINGKTAKPKAKTLGNEHVIVNATLEQHDEWQAEAIALAIMYEDDDIIVINKPAGMVTHPAAGNLTKTLVNALLHHYPALVNLPRAGLIHRLDKDTTGLLIIAKTLTAHTALTKDMQARKIKREYIAVVNGLSNGAGTIDAAMSRHPNHRKKMTLSPTGKPAVTHYRAINYFRAHTLVKVKLETGRTHQIRVHLASISHPVTGDQTYGQLRLTSRPSDELAEYLRGFKRQALHARKLTLVHPISHQEHSWTAPIPDDMQHLIDLLEKETAHHEEEALDDWEWSDKDE